MLRPESHRAVARYGTELQNLIDTCTSETKELKRVFNKGLCCTGAEAIQFSSSIESEVGELQHKITPLVSLSLDTPRAGGMLTAAFANINAISDLLDSFETQLDSEHGIKPVVPKLNLHKEHDVKRELNDMRPALTPRTTWNGDAKNSTTLPSAGNRVGNTPKSARKRVEDMPIPGTPKMEDFGLSLAELNKLGVCGGVGGALSGGRGRVEKRLEFGVGEHNPPHPHAQTIATQLRGNGEYLDRVAGAISALGIETPAQVAERFESRRHRAMTTVMVTTTPRLKGGGKEQVMDYTGLAGGYYEEEAVEGEDLTFTHRQLNFDETPRGRGGDVARRIRDGYKELGIWKETVDIDLLEEAGFFLMESGESVFGKPQLSKVLEKSLKGGVSCYAVIACLTKLGVLKMEKTVGEEAMYRVVA